MHTWITSVYPKRWYQGCGYTCSEPTTRHCGLFSSLLSCSPYTLYTAQFQFIRHSLNLSDNVLHDWLLPYPWVVLWHFLTFQKYSQLVIIILTLIHGLLRASSAVIRLSGFIISIPSINFLAWSVTESHSGLRYWIMSIIIWKTK